MLNGVEDEWLAFLNNRDIQTTSISQKKDVCIENDLDRDLNRDNDSVLDRDLNRNLNRDLDIDNNIPKCSDIYISTKTKISYLNKAIDLNYLFWQIPIIQYHERCEGVIKKQMKFQSLNREDLENILNKTIDYYYSKSDIISSIDNPNGKIKFKDTRKINIGICRKDILNTRCKIKSAFYNCFVVVYRILIDTNTFKEIHIKIFNTGKLEIPGVKDDNLLNDVLDKIVEFISKIDGYQDIQCLKNRTETVLINSNFNCGYFINRDKLYDILRHQYKINCCYDPCSYPGIQCGFYYNVVDPDYKQSGSQPLSCKDDFIKISFMVFRTGSVLMVGKCSEEILNNIYTYIRGILEREYHQVGIDDFGESLVKQQDKLREKKHKKKYIYI